MDQNKNRVLWMFIVTISLTYGEQSCPRPETILPCICTNRNQDIQIWCTHSDLPQVSKGIQNVGDLIKYPLDEIIIENNYIPSLPGRLFQNVKILRLMLRHNGLERLSIAWLETQEMSLLEIFIVEHDLKHIPAESLMKLQNLQAVTIQSNNLKRIPVFTSLPKLKYINIQSESLHSITENNFENLPALEKLTIQGSPNLQTLKENAFYNLPNLKKLSITECGIVNIHMRSLSLLPSLLECSFNNNAISDAAMVGRATRDLPMLSTLNLNYNNIEKLSEGAFVDQAMLEKIYLANNLISVIHHGAFHRVPKLKTVDLNYNLINRIHPESFLQQSGSGVEELNLIGNQITHISEFKSLLDALPRLKYLDMSDNLLQEIPRGALRGHPSLERLHLNKNSIKFIEAEAFVAMPALRELHLSNNSLSDFIDGTFWDLPALKGLDLSFNYFQRVQPKLLFNLPALRRINLSHNRLTMIDPITFMASPLLEYVNISGNALVSIHPATFRNLANLYEIDASLNRLLEFIPGLPRGLENLNLKSNQIHNLPVPPSPDLDLPSLRNLDVSHNGIQKVATGTFKTLHNLRSLIMKRNGLRQVDNTMFNDLRQLEKLDLGNNQIISINPKSFVNLQQLKQINFHGNVIDTFELSTIQESDQVTVLDLSKNNIKSLNPGSVKKPFATEILNISSNRLTELPQSLNMVPKLKIIDASNNNIKHFDGNSVNNINGLSEILLPNNKIIELRSGSFENLKDLITIVLENNNIEIVHPNAISNLPNLISLNLGRNHIIDIPDRVFTNLPKLKVLDLQGNRLQFISSGAFENVPLIQYLNVSNNQLTNLDSSGLRQLPSLEVLDLSYNKLTKITATSFTNMEWLVELNLDHNMLCQINGQPFDNMPRLKVLSLRNNQLRFVAEVNFLKLRNNIAIFDIDGNPLICNCNIIWLKSWLSESTSIGPRCTDGSLVKRIPFTNNDCSKYQIIEDDVRSCSDGNPALLSSLATSQVFSSLNKVKDLSSHYKNNYNTNKINNKPLPEESEYFYDDYIEYPYNDTVVHDLIGETDDKGVNNHQNITELYEEAETVKNSTNKPAASLSSGFTFFGMPLPNINVGKIFNTRKIDWSDKNNKNNINIKSNDTPKFETGNFSPVLPTTAGGFMPIAGPVININDTYFNRNTNLQTNTPIFNDQGIEMQSEVHEVTFNSSDKTSYYNFNQTNIKDKDVDSIKTMQEMQTTERDGLLITTDTMNDMSLQTWLESSTTSKYIPLPTQAASPSNNDEVHQPTAQSAMLIPDGEELIRRNHSVRTATVTKVQMPHVEHYETRDIYLPVINREAKTRIYPPDGNNNKKTLNSWYYENYNKTNLEPYIAPGIQASHCSKLVLEFHTIIFTICFKILY